MKNKFLGICLVVMLVFFNGCSDSFNYTSAEIEITEPIIPGTIITVQAVKNNADLINNEIYTFEGTNNYMEAFVVSSDASGNFYHELVLQDLAVNPTAGIKLLLNRTSLFQSYEVGRKVFVKLDGLSVGVSNGVVVLGRRNLGSVVEIPFPIIDDHVIRSAEILEVVPLEIGIDDFSENLENLYVEIDNVQFIYNIIGENPVTFAGEPTDEFDGERMLVSCETGSTTFLSTSTFADFKSVSLPSGKGKIKGILARNFYDDFFVVNINLPEDIHFDDTSRCDPEFLNCGNSEAGGLEILFNEDFQGISNTNDIEEELGWINESVSGGNEVFSYKNSYGNKFLTISAYETLESPMSVWLITPEIFMNELANEELSFNISSSFDNGTILSVYVTDNFSGNPNTTDWTQLNATVPIGPSGAAMENFLNSKTDISCLEGSIRIGFKYHGSDPDRTTTYNIDNVRITGSE
ncbi:MAG TPA: DUF5689 domain-containing protein [Salinimicrobium sp.]|nr:DUF5689 domain-containing protein [Salinimicrobium sp.]